MASDPVQGAVLARLKTALAMTAGSTYWHTIPAESVIVGVPNVAQLPTGPLAWVAFQGVTLSPEGGLLTQYNAETTISIGMMAPAERTTGNTDAEARFIQCARMIQDIQNAVLNAWAGGTGLGQDGVILIPSMDATTIDGAGNQIEGYASVETVWTFTSRWGIR